MPSTGLSPHRSAGCGWARGALALACLALSLSASCASRRQEVSGAWLIGTWYWVGGQSVLEFKDGADVITWTMRRERFLSTRPARPSARGASSSRPS